MFATIKDKQMLGKYYYYRGCCAALPCPCGHYIRQNAYFRSLLLK